MKKVKKTEEKMCRNWEKKVETLYTILHDELETKQASAITMTTVIYSIGKN